MKNSSRCMHKSNTNGFTLVETLVAISIFVLVIIGPITVAWRSMQSAYYANEQTTAIFLAQEALESIRLLRDNQALKVYKGPSTDSWEWYDDLLPECTDVNDGCDLDRKDGSYRSCAIISDCRLKLNTGNAGYVYGYSNAATWKPSAYTRKIVVTEPAGSGQARVVVTVTWTSPLFSNAVRTVTLEGWVYDQYKRFGP